jgi:hypothetical protein
MRRYKMALRCLAGPDVSSYVATQHEKPFSLKS